MSNLRASYVWRNVCENESIHFQFSQWGIIHFPPVIIK